MSSVLIDEPEVVRQSLTLDETGWPMLPPTLVSIHRTSPDDEQSRSIFCTLDGARIAELLFGESCTCEVAPGEHSLRVHNTLIWKRVSFDVPPGGHLHFTVWNRACRGYYTLLLLVGVAPIWLGVARGVPVCSAGA
jgi:hypothetical protein